MRGELAVELGEQRNTVGEAKLGAMDLLRQLDDQMLKNIGIASAGHRLRIQPSM